MGVLVGQAEAFLSVFLRTRVSLVPASVEPGCHWMILSRVQG